MWLAYLRGVIKCRYTGNVESELCNLSPKQTAGNADYTITWEQSKVVGTNTENRSNYSHGAEIRLLGVGWQ